MYQYVVCNQAGCPRQDQVRRVERPRLGDGMVALVAVSCECSPDIEMRRVAAPQYEIATLGEQFTAWVRDEGWLKAPSC